MEGCIYLITCLVNGKKYVGLHGTPDPRKRWKEHIYDTKRGSECMLHKAIRKHGEENFTIETLCVCSHNALPHLEAYYAEQYGTYKWDPEPGYNMCWCGDKPSLGMKHLPETIKKMQKNKTPEHVESVRRALSGRKKTPEEIENHRQSLLKYYQANPKKTSPETREKMRQAHLLRNAKLRQEKSLQQEEKCQNVST